VQGEYGTCFCSRGIMFIERRHGRGTIYIDGRVIVPVDEVHKRALAQCRGLIFIGGRETVPVQYYLNGQMSVSWCNSYYEFILCARAVCKNRDKLITLTVRVISSCTLLKSIWR